MNSVLQGWVMELGLRHQGTLLTAVRGCDTEAKEGTSKKLSRFYRAYILNAHCGDQRKSGSFIRMPESLWELRAAMDAFRKDHDSCPHHFVMHMVHSAEIVGYYHPEEAVRVQWLDFYFAFCRTLHVTPETKEELDARLNADEASFAARDKA